MATPGYCIAEAHVTRKLYREKLKKMEEEQRAKSTVDYLEVKKSSDTNSKNTIGCFGMLKKIHPNNNQGVANKSSKCPQASL